MPVVPQYKTSYGTQYHQGNWGGNFSYPQVIEELQVSGSGVQRRAKGWKKLPMPSRLTPLAYSARWDYTKAVKFYRAGNYVYIPFGPFTGSFTEVTYQMERAYGYRGVWGNQVDNAERSARGKLLTQMKGEGTNLANIIAERRQTISMVANTLDKIVFTVKDLKRGRVESAIRRLFGDGRHAGAPKPAKLKGKDIANQWLELQYGWKPLLSDIYDLLETNFERSSFNPTVFRASSARSQMGENPARMSDYGQIGSEHVGSIKTTGIYKYMVRAYPNQSLSAPEKFGLTNPLVPLWEVTPWSFVVDWFIPVGNYLEQLTADHGWTFMDGCRSTLEKCEMVFAGAGELKTSDANGSTLITSTIQGGRSTYVQFQRSLLGGFPSPNVPSFRNPLTLSRLANSLALLAQFAKPGKLPPGYKPERGNNRSEWNDVVRHLQH
jgi:hypothetical protein